MKIETKISFHQYLKLLYTLTYKKPIMILIIAVDVTMIVWITGYYFDIITVPHPTIYQFITLFLITIVQPLVIFNTIRTNYYTSNHLRETMQMEFTPELIKIKGDSFYSEFSWSKAYKTVELENWFLIYQNNLSAIIIPKKSFTVNQANEFKQMFNSEKK